MKKLLQGTAIFCIAFALAMPALAHVRVYEGSHPVRHYKPVENPYMENQRIYITPETIPYMSRRNTYNYNNNCSCDVQLQINRELQQRYKKCIKHGLGDWCDILFDPAEQL